jgi:hypothetical protein
MLDICIADPEFQKKEPAVIEDLLPGQVFKYCQVRGLA